MIDAGVEWRFMTARPGNISYVPLGWISAVQTQGTKICVGVQMGFVAASSMGNASFSHIADPVCAFAKSFPKKAHNDMNIFDKRKQVVRQ
jgi:hypothetical protein